MRIFPIALLAALIALVAAPGANGAISQADVDYDLGSPPAPAPVNQNFLDIYRPDGSSPGDSRPVVVYAHGGGWRIGDKDNQIADKVNLFTGAGYVFVSINYRLSPVNNDYDPGRIRFPDHPDDVGEAIGWIDRNIGAYGGDPERLLLIGHSSGAHLVSLVTTNPAYIERYGVDPWQVIGTVSLDSAAYDVPDRISELSSRPDDLATYYTAFGTPEENAAEGTWVAGSPMTWAGAGDPDHLLVTQAANPRRIADSESMATALGQDPAGVFRAPYNHEGINDAVGSPADGSGETQAIMDFVARSVVGAKAPKAKITDAPRRTVRAKFGRAKVKFRFRSSVEGSRFECRLDGKKFKACRSPKTYRLKKGRYTFKVRPFAPSGRPGKAKSLKFRVR